jgi:hypothetical protein
MTVQQSTTVRDARNDAWETAIGTTPKLEFFTGSMPANPATADSGTKLVSMTLPSDWMTTSSSGVKVLVGSWTAVGIAAGSAAYYRIKNSAGTVCHEQGTITSVLIGTGDLLLDNVVIAVGQTVNVTVFQKTEGAA